jgi:predicted small metal-binding protein
MLTAVRQKQPRSYGTEHVFLRPTTGRESMKELHCIVPGCQWHTRHDTEAEIIRRAAEHLRETHGETVIRESMLETIKANIQPSKGQAA